ncbi:MAG TPA: alpha/beta fold hydrolase, partial [Thermoleophilaceae bacterium]
MSREHIDLSAGRIGYRDVGEGPPLLFLNGLFVDGQLWRNVTPSFESDHRCVVPDLPIGSHTIPLKPDADVTFLGLARLILEFIEKLGLDDVTIVANDTAGALTQIAMTQPGNERIARVVLTDCDAFENCPPGPFKAFKYAARVPPLLTALMQPMRWRPLRRLPYWFGAKRPIDPEVEAAYVRPFFTQSEIRRDLMRFFRALDKRYTIEAAVRLPEFDRPVLIAWATEDKVFPFEHAHKLAALLPDAR